MEVPGDVLSAGILSTQVGYPLPHCGKGASHCVSSDRQVGLPSALVLDSEHEEVGDSGFGRRDVTEGNGDTVALTELCPAAEDLGLGLPMLVSGRRGGEVERSAQISLEDISEGSRSSFHGWSCG